MVLGSDELPSLPHRRKKPLEQPPDAHQGAGHGNDQYLRHGSVIATTLCDEIVIAKLLVVSASSTSMSMMVGSGEG